MHVLQLLPRLEVGGVERGVVDLAKGLIARGHQVTVVSAGGPLVERLLQLGARHVPLPVDEKQAATVLSCARELTRLITAGRVDLVHARSRVPAWSGYLAARRTQRPFVTTAHGFYAPHLASRVMVWGRLVIVPSEALSRYLMERFGVPKDRLRVIPRGVDLEGFTFQPLAEPHRGPWRIGVFGRLSRIKGHAVAIRACERLRRQGRDVRLCVVGDVPGSPTRAALESLIASCGLQDTVEWHGVRQEIPQLLASMDLVLVPSVYPESFGRSAIEAHAVGRPVVASRLGALAELIDDGVTGVLVRPGDPEALAQGIARLLDDAGLRQRCVAAARQKVEAEWTLDRMVDRTLAVYEECLHQPRILIWKLSALGDVVLSTPSLRAIRRHFPQAQITLAVGREAYEVVARCPYLNDVLIYDPRRKDRGWWRRWQFLRGVRRKRFDWSVDLQNSRATHLMAWLAGIPIRVGYRRKFGWLLNRPVRLPRVVLAPIAHQHYLLTQAGLSTPPLATLASGEPRPPAETAAQRRMRQGAGSTDGEVLELWPSPLEEQAAERIVGAHGTEPAPPLVGLHPGGSGRWKTKRWELERWAKLCDALAARNVRVLITGGPGEEAQGEALRRLTSSSPELLIGKTSLMELACLIKRCDVFVAHDSSPLHLAAAVGTPTIALFGPTDPARHLPPSFTGQVIEKEVFCRPCYAARCRTVTHACMRRITVDEVLSAVLAQLAECGRSSCASSTSPHT